MLTVDVYSDLIRPWCYVGKRRLERSLALSGRSATVRWHPFELNEVREWQERGQRLGIAGVPFFVINGTVVLSGAAAGAVSSGDRAAGGSRAG